MPLDGVSMGAPALSRYFFHVQDGSFEADLVGVEMGSEREARQHAIALCVETLANQRVKALAGTEWQITTVDEQGHAIFTLNFGAGAVSS